MLECRKDNMVETIEARMESEVFVLDVDLGVRFYIHYGWKDEDYQVTDVQDIHGNHLPYGTHMNETIIRFNDKDWLIKRDHQRLWVEEDNCLRG